jgi:hypothetical protein
LVQLKKLVHQLISHILTFIVASGGIVNENLIEFFANLLSAVSIFWLKKRGLTFSSAAKRVCTPILHQDVPIARN